MKTILPMLFAGLTLGLVLASVPAFGCGCQAVWDGNPTPCSGCTFNFYYQEICGVPGCTYGYCITTGYGVCCKSHFTTLNVDTSDCNPFYDCGFNCPPARRHASSHVRKGRTVPQSSAVSATVAVTSGRWPKRTPPFDAIFFVPDRCRHTFGVLDPQNLNQQRSPARSTLSRHSASGGL